MERHRCAKCRNPIRRGGDVSTSSSGPQESWFHPDCWATVQTAKQKDYLRQVELRGLEALLAPYISASPVGSKAAGLAVEPAVKQVAHVVAQGEPTDIRADSAAPLRQQKSA